MQITASKNDIIVNDITSFDLAKTLECGQVFRYEQNEDRSYTVVSSDKAAKISQNDGVLTFHNMDRDCFESYWRAYFDLDRDYATIKLGIAVDDMIKTAMEHGDGIRILKQNTFEALISFIISQNNNIPRIKKIIQAFCLQFGKKINTPLHDAKEYFSFPSPETLEGLTAEDLAFCKCGFRAKYIADAVKKINSGEVDLSALACLSNEDAMKILMQINGIGPKVANCIMLYGCARFDAFPIDVWIKRIIDKYYGEGFDPARYGQYGGVAQQYLFYTERTGGFSSLTSSQ